MNSDTLALHRTWVACWGGGGGGGGGGVTKETTGLHSTIIRPPIQANNFKLKSITLQVVQNIQFTGLPSEEPNRHISNFSEVCDIIKYNGVPDEAIRLRLFPFSPRDKAKDWLNQQPLNSITTWNDLV